MAQYTISPRSEATFEGFTVRATSYQHAANIVARRLHGRRATALRVSIGLPTQSGVYQAYVPYRDGGQTSIGGNFHVAAAVRRGVGR